MFARQSRFPDNRHSISALLVLCVATMLVGTLALVGSMPTRAASQERSAYIGSDVQKAAATGAPGAPGAPKAPLTDTSMIAYTGAGQSGDDIFVINPDGSEQLNLTNSAADEFMPAWSPDASKIAFAGIREVPFANTDIFVMNADGANRINLTNDQDYQQYYPTWSSDGDKIAFEQQGEIFTINANGSGRVNLTNTPGFEESDPNWSHDGLKIAYYSLFGDIWVMNANGTNQVLLASNAYGPDWSSDDTHIAFSRYDEATCISSAIWVMNANGTNAHIIDCPPGTVRDFDPTWSWDDTKIAFARQPNSMAAAGGSADIWVMDANSTNQVNVTNGTTGDSREPDWGLGGRRSIVQVKDEDGNLIQDAEVYRDSLLLGRSNSRGIVNLPAPELDEHLIARSLVHTGDSPKPNHDGWSYHVWLTNVTQENDGNQTTYTITDTNKITQTVVLKRDNAQIGLNIVGSVSYNATQDNLADIAAGLKKASEFLFDVTDGQMFFEKLTLYENKENYVDADMQFDAWQWPAATFSGIFSPTGHLHLPGPGFNGKAYTGGWHQTKGFRTFAHEFGHYALGAHDEYQVLDGQGGSAMCTLDQISVLESRRASIMDTQFRSTELCADNNHNPETEQGQVLHESVWATFVRNWRDAGSNPRWTLRTPISRGAVNPGPSSLLVINNIDTTIVGSLWVACSRPLIASVYWNDNGTHRYLKGIGVFLDVEHPIGMVIEGNTDSKGAATIYGAAPGDEVSAAGSVPSIPNVFYAARAPVANCSNPIELELKPINGSPSTAASNGNVPSAFNTFWLTSKLNRALGTVTISVHFDGEPASAPSVSLSQDGGELRPVSLTYDPRAYTYSGSTPYDPAHALRFLASAAVDAPSGNVISAYNLSGAEYQVSGPFIGDGVQQVPQTLPPPEWWEIFSSEDMVSLSVNSTSMADGSGVMVVETDMPPGTPPDLLAVGGPYSIEGDNPITGQVGASLNFQAELFCGLQEGSIAVYQYDLTNGTWTALPTNLNTDWNRAYASLSQWGIYAVFAQPNTVATFSDVPEGSTFFNYVQWIACHRIASGYSDGTFGVGNNATRGQISKMVALAYNWNLEPLQDGGYSFADVPPDHTFYLHIESAYRMGVLGGYPCGGEGEPCDDRDRPYFRPGNNATRGQIAKILSSASIFTEPAVGQTFEDVPSTHTFYQYVERMSSRGIIGGYPCGGEQEPCGPENRPYFRPGNNATRGQLSKMIYLTLQPR
jgi:Tol biopolymer transport system component